MKRTIKITFQLTVALVLITLLAMLVTGAMILFNGIGGNEPFTYLIVLGNKIESSEPSPLLRDRIEAAAAYMEDHPDVIAIATGYQSEGADLSEAQCIYDGLTERGIAPERILLEEQASTTQENFQYSRVLLEEELGFVPQNIGVLSSEFHLLRAKMIAKENGIDAVTIAASTSDAELFFKYFVREIFMVWYDGIKIAIS